MLFGVIFDFDSWEAWFIPMPFSLLIFISDEFRRWCIRRYVDGFVEHETYY